MIERFFLNIVKNFDNMENYNIKNKIRGRKMDTNEKSNISQEELEKSKNIIGKLWNYYTERIVGQKKSWNVATYIYYYKCTYLFF